jgi:hypothetical protein
MPVAARVGNDPRNAVRYDNGMINLRPPYLVGGLLLGALLGAMFAPPCGHECAVKWTFAGAAIGIAAGLAFDAYRNRAQAASGRPAAALSQLRSAWGRLVGMETSNGPRRRVAWPIVALLLALVTAVLWAGYFMFWPVRFDLGDHPNIKQKPAQQSATPATH